MSSLSSASTTDEVKASYDDNASYAEDNSPTKCRAFITAGTILLRRIPKSGKQGRDNEFELNSDLIRQELETARRWLSTSGTAAKGGGIIHCDLDSDFRY